MTYCPTCGAARPEDAYGHEGPCDNVDFHGDHALEVRPVKERTDLLAIEGWGDDAADGWWRAKVREVLGA